MTHPRFSMCGRHGTRTGVRQDIEHRSARQDAVRGAHRGGCSGRLHLFDQLLGAKAARERPALSKLLDYARDGDTDLVYRIDRLGRFLIDVLNTVDHMQKRGTRS